MRKTPSYLKGLAETRARAAGDVLRLQQILDQVKESLDKAQAEVDACDVLIKKFDDRLEPTEIEPVNHWEGRYGRRGALKEAVLQLLRDRAPGVVTTTEIGWQMQLKFDIGFLHWKDRKRWMTNSIGNCLKTLAGEGVIEMCPELMKPGGVASWRCVGVDRYFDDEY